MVFIVEQTHTVPDLDNDEGYVSMDKLEEITLSGAENAIPGKLSSYALDEGQKDKDEPEKVFRLT